MSNGPHTPDTGHEEVVEALGRDVEMIEPLSVGDHKAVADMIDGVFAKSGFNARRLAEAAHLFLRMVREPETTVTLTVAGAMTPIGMSGPIIELIRAGFVDMIVSTGANLYHDLHRPLNCPVVQGDFQADDNELADTGIARIYDTFIWDSETLMATDRVILEAVKGIPGDEPLSTARIHKHLGDRVRESAPHPEKSILAVAAEHDLPIYTSSPGDSSIGMNLVIPYLFDGGLRIDPLRDILETTAVVRDSEKNGVVEIGGGSPKNFFLQTQPMLHQIFRDESGGGHDYFIQLTADAPHWGGLSGATPQEARSWGKVKDAFVDNVVVYSCASLTFPLLAAYVLHKAEPREPRRLLGQIDGMVDTMLEAVEQNPLLNPERKVLGKKAVKRQE